MLPGLAQYLNRNGYSLIRRVNGASVSWKYDPAAQPLVDAYTLDQAKTEVKRLVDLVEAEKFDAGLTAVYGFIPPPQQMLKWPIKEAEAAAWQAWKDGGEVGQEPSTPTIDAEITATQNRAVRVAKTLIKASALEALRSALEGNSVALDDQINAANDFVELGNINIQSGWPV